MKQMEDERLPDRGPQRVACCSRIAPRGHKKNTGKKRFLFLFLSSLFQRDPPVASFIAMSVRNRLRRANEHCQFKGLKYLLCSTIKPTGAIADRKRNHSKTTLREVNSSFLTLHAHLKCEARKKKD